MSFANIPAQSRARVFCFPFAGGGASYFRAWSPLAGPVALVSVQPPGREERFTEKPFDRMADFVAAAADALTSGGLTISSAPGEDKQDCLSSIPYALYGHSMGALVCFELAHELRRRGAPQPRHLFVSGAPAPQRAAEVPAIQDLPREDFLNAVRRYDGIPEEVLQSKELMDLLIPRLRADFAITGTYVYREQPPLACPITAFGGADDETVTPSMIEAWREQTVMPFEHEIFPGGHFFLSSRAREIVAAFRKGLP